MHSVWSVLFQKLYGWFIQTHIYSQLLYMINEAHIFKCNSEAEWKGTRLRPESICAFYGIPLPFPIKLLYKSEDHDVWYNNFLGS